MPQLTANPSVGDTVTDSGWQYRWTGDRWVSDGYTSQFDPFAAFEGPFRPAGDLPAADGVSWVSPGNGAARSWYIAPDSSGEPVLYTEANAATTGGWWTFYDNWNSATSLYTAGHYSLIFPNTSGSPTEFATGTAGALSFNPAPQFSEINAIRYYTETDTLVAVGRTNSATDYFDWSRYNQYSTRPTGADSTQKSFYEISTATVNIEVPFRTGGSAIVPDGIQLGGSTLFTIIDRIEIEFGAAVTNTDLGTEIANTTWEIRRGSEILGEWYFQSGGGTQQSADSNAAVNNHDLVRLYDLYYRQIT